MNKQPELHTTNLLMQPLSISFENAALQILRFSKIHENTHAWVIPLHTHPTIELHYILSGAGQIQIDDTLFPVETNDIYVTLPFVPHCQISSAADIMEEYCVECTLELPPAVKGETDPLASLRRFLSRQAFSSAGAPDELLPLLRRPHVLRRHPAVLHTPHTPLVQQQPSSTTRTRASRRNASRLLPVTCLFLLFFFSL